MQCLLPPVVSGKAEPGYTGTLVARVVNLLLQREEADKGLGARDGVCRRGQRLESEQRFQTYQTRHHR